MKTTVIKQISNQKEMDIFIEDNILNISTKNEGLQIKINSKLYTQKLIKYKDENDQIRMIYAFACDA